jgi:hypothetical protein
MSTDFITKEKIRMQELFDGRLTPFGVVEKLVTSNDSERTRVLTDGHRFVWVYADDGGEVSGFSRYGWNAPRRILEAVAEVFNTEIYSSFPSGQANSGLRDTSSRAIPAIVIPTVPGPRRFLSPPRMIVSTN